METNRMYKNQHEKNIGLLQEPKKQYGVTSEEVTLFTRSFSNREKRFFKMYYCKLGYSDALDFFDKTVENYIPNFKINPDEIFYNRYNNWCKGKGHINHAPNYPMSKEDLKKNLNEFKSEFVSVFIDPFYRLFFPCDFFMRLIANRVKSILEANPNSQDCLEQHLKELKIAKKSSADLNTEMGLLGIEDIYNNAIQKAKASGKKQSKTINMETIDANAIVFEVKDKNSSMSSCYDGTVKFVIDGKEEKDTHIFGKTFCQEIYQIVKCSKCFGAPEKESGEVVRISEKLFIDTFNMIGDSEQLEIGEQQYFFFLVSKFVDFLAKKMGCKYGTKYKEYLFKRIQGKKDFLELYRNNAYRFKNTEENDDTSDSMFITKINNCFKNK